MLPGFPSNKLKGNSLYDFAIFFNSTIYFSNNMSSWKEAESDTASVIWTSVFYFKNKWNAIGRVGSDYKLFSCSSGSKFKFEGNLPAAYVPFVLNKNLLIFYLATASVSPWTKTSDLKTFTSITKSLTTENNVAQSFRTHDGNSVIHAFGNSPNPQTSKFSSNEGSSWTNTNFTITGGVYRGFASDSSNYVFSGGGAISGTTSPAFLRRSNSLTGSWSTISMPDSTTYNYYPYIIGNSNGFWYFSAIKDGVSRFWKSPDFGSWTELMSSPTNAFNSFIYKNKVYAVDPDDSSIYQYTEETTAWKTITTSLPPISGSGFMFRTKKEII